MLHRSNARHAIGLACASNAACLPEPGRPSSSVTRHAASQRDGGDGRHCAAGNHRLSCFACRDGSRRTGGSGRVGCIMESLEQYREKADRCRRLARMISDRQAVEGLTALATEFDAKAAALEAAWVKTA